MAALHNFADWLEKKLPEMTTWKPMGEANYNYMLRNILLLPMDSRDVAHLGRSGARPLSPATTCRCRSRASPR